MSSTSAINSALSTATTSTSSLNVSSILAAATGSSSAGIDVSAAVDAALYAARATERVWQGEQTTLSNQQSALTSIQTATQALYNDFDSLNSFTGPLSSRAVTSSNSTAVSASAAKGTATGTHTITVTNLASTASWYSDLSASATATLPSSSFTLTTESGSSATFTTGSNGSGTLNDLAASINNANLGVKASVLSDSTGARLSIVSTTSGSATDFSISSADTTGTTWSSPTLASGQTFGAGTFNITVGGNTTTVNITDGESLSSLASDINGQNLGVTASVVTNSNGSSYLKIDSSDGTTPFTINQPGYGFSQATTGKDAAFTVDGVPLTSATNSVTTAIKGVTLNLTGTASASSPVTLTVSPNTSTVATAIQQFVTDYNTAIGLVNAQFSFSSTTSSTGVLASDPTIRQLQSSLLSVLNFVNTSSSPTGTTISTLGALGISTNQDGTLSLDTDTLSSQIVNNPDGVQNFLMGTASNGFAKQVTSALGSFTQAGGSFSVDLSSMKTTYNRLTDQINDYENLYIANQKTILTAMYSKAEAALQSLPTQLKQIQAQLGNSSNS